MNKENQLNDDALVKEGIRLLESGEPASYIYRWLRGQIDDPEVRSVILDRIHSKDGQIKKAKVSTEYNQEMVNARKIRAAKFVYEDLLYAIKKLSRIGYVLILLGLVWLYSSPIHAILTVLLGIAVLVGTKALPLKQRNILLLLTSGYVFFVFVEFLLPRFAKKDYT